MVNGNDMVEHIESCSNCIMLEEIKDKLLSFDKDKPNTIFKILNESVDLIDREMDNCFNGSLELHSDYCKDEIENLIKV